MEVKKARSVDSEIRDNVVIDYDGKRKIVRVNFYDFNFVKMSSIWSKAGLLAFIFTFFKI